MRVEFTSAADIPPAAWPWTFINPRTEWADKKSGAIVIETAFAERFTKLRRMFGAALPINSGYRTPEHNQEVSDTGDAGPHTTGQACDIRIFGAPALELVHLALEVGFTGIGVSQKGEQSERFIHLDDLPRTWGPRPGIWSY